MVAIQIRDVPDGTREILVREARRREQSLQAYLIDVLNREADSTRNLQWLGEWVPLTGSYDGPPVAEIVRGGRAERELHILDRAADH